MMIWTVTQQPVNRETEQRLGELTARWTRLFRRPRRAARARQR